MDRAGELAQRSKEAVTDLTERGKEAVSRQKAQVSAAIEAGKQGYREAKSQDVAGKPSPAFEES